LKSKITQDNKKRYIEKKKRKKENEKRSEEKGFKGVCFGEA